MITLIRKAISLAVPLFPSILFPIIGLTQTPVVTESKLGGSLVLREVRMKCGEVVEVLPRYVELDACGAVSRFPVSYYRVGGATRVGESVFVLAFGDYTNFVAEVCRDGALDFVCTIPDLSIPTLFSARLHDGFLVFKVEGADLLSGEKKVASCQVNSMPVFGGCIPLCSKQSNTPQPVPRKK